MPKLVCSVENCAYNAEHLCALNEIQVGGQNATSTEATCCDSFRQEGESVSNCVNGSCASKETEIDCEATNCVHNDNCKCHADSIDVCGCGAKHAKGTECATFCCE